MHACIHTYVHTYIHTYVHARTHNLRKPGGQRIRRPQHSLENSYRITRSFHQRLPHGSMFLSLRSSYRIRLATHFTPANKHRLLQTHHQVQRFTSATFCFISSFSARLGKSARHIAFTASVGKVTLTTFCTGPGAQRTYRGTCATQAPGPYYSKHVYQNTSHSVWIRKTN